MNGYFDYSEDHSGIRNEIPEAFRKVWDKICRPGNWWRGEERIAIAREARAAVDCELCQARKASLSPNSIEGNHTRVTDLPDVVVDATHRLVTDSSRLTEVWLRDFYTQGMTDGHYVELVGVVGSVAAIDTFHRAIGLSLEVLPEPRAGDPTGYRPPVTSDMGGWVPMVRPSEVSESEADIYDGNKKSTHNVLAALSLDPDSVRMYSTLGKALYLPFNLVGNPASKINRAISRLQIELLASRVSAMNECFYCCTSHTMMLREVAKGADQNIDLTVVTVGSEVESGVPYGSELTAFARAAMGNSSDELAAARLRVVEKMGESALFDTAAVIACFQFSNRISNSTGIPLDEPVNVMTGEMREELGLDRFNSAHGKQALSPLKKLLAPLFRPLLLRQVKRLLWNDA